MGNCATSTTDTTGGPGEVAQATFRPQIEGKPDLKTQLSQARREVAHNLEVKRKEAEEREKKRQKEYETLAPIWLKMFEAAVQRWIEMNHDALLAAVQENKTRYDFTIDVTVPSETTNDQRDSRKPS
ncbi:MAG: hypothetical protein KGL39_01470 [Patescibacteria group bacterium]|nr:hypothetical protein [Patescibacteria group bacterium]